MKGISAFLTLSFFFILLSVNAQVSKVKEFEGKKYYKTLFSADALEQIQKADKYQAKADGYMMQAREYNQEISDYTAIVDKTRDDDTRIDAMKKMAKLKKKRLSRLEKAYKYYTKGNVRRYSAYQQGFKKGRLKGAATAIKSRGLDLERAANANKKQAEKITSRADDLDGEDKRVALADAFNYEILAINNLIDAHKLYNNDSTLLPVKKDSILTPNVKDIEGFFYSVHVSMFNAEPDKSTFKGIEPMYVDTNLNGVLQYAAGIFKSAKQAENAKKEVVKLGFDGAYVVAYEEGARIPMEEAMSLSSVNAVTYAIPQPFLIAGRPLDPTAIVSSTTKTTVTPIKTDPSAPQDTLSKFDFLSSGKSQTRVKLDLYQSKEAVITSRLRLNGNDQAKLYEATQKEKYASQLLGQVEEMYSDIEYYKQAEAIEQSKKLKEDFRDKHTMLQVKVFITLIQATQLYVEVNEARYQVYKKHLPSVRQASESPAAMRGKEYEEIAEAFYMIAKQGEADAAGLEFQSDKYLKLMEANDRLLLAVENQETAFSVYFDLVTDEDLKQIALSDIKSDEQPTTTTPQHENNDLGNKKSIKVNNNKTSIEIVETKYIVIDTYVYSKYSPKPKKAAPSKGIVFKIQFGLFAEMPEDNFGSITPITIEKLKGKRYSRFLVGNFRTYEAATHALPVVKNKGYKQAHIVAFRNGKRVNPTAAKHIARKNEKEYETLINEEILIIEGKKKRVTPTKLGQVVATDLSKTTDLFYTVQLGVYNRILTSKELKTTQNINFERLPKGAIRYTKGMYSSKLMADKERDRLRRNGFKEAFVVAYFKGKRANMSSIEKTQGAVRSLSTAATANQTKKSSLLFKLQLGALREVSPLVKKKLQEVGKDYKVESYTNAKGLTVITAGDFESYDAADSAKHKINKLGFDDCFVVAFKNEKQIPTSLALRLQK